MIMPLLRIETLFELRRWLDVIRSEGVTLGLVPTMGALHEGHLSLIRASQSACTRTIVTIFVNPTQFGPKEDFGRYPRNLDEDCRKLSELKVDAVFLPTPELMYPPGHSTMVAPPIVARRWEGEHRPGHFAGVATVVLKLFNLVPADKAFFGSKDYQQCRVIESMTTDLNVPIKIERCAIVREPDGLAKSSRNRYLDSAQRPAALSLSGSLHLAEQLARDGRHDAGEIAGQMEARMRAAGIERIDYIAIVDANTMEPVTRIGKQPIQVLIAAHVGDTRLIDNISLT
jgi:pantoate--beta-alanine ligase